MDEALPVAAHSISEIKDAVRELRDSMPDSVLAKLAEQKIERLERERPTDPGIGDEGIAGFRGL
ncbi:hypothetical protein [Microvirga sp. TS319]|uniref:hypothetical protein n=1 Tax=Microvirga sp. TS319 TaxID=3241165 RepID=UPI00351A3193